MNSVQKRIADLILTPDKYSEIDLHEIKNCCCFLRDCDDSIDIANVEQYLNEFIRLKEANIPIDIKNLRKQFNIL